MAYRDGQRNHQLLRLPTQDVVSHRSLLHRVMPFLAQRASDMARFVPKDVALCPTRHQSRSFSARSGARVWWGVERELVLASRIG